MIRPANLSDLEKLIAIENRAFVMDRFPRRTFRYLLKRANAVTIVDEQDEKLRGYAAILFNTGTSLARLYSIAVDPQFQGKTVGQGLLTASEQEALRRDCVALRIEVRKDNAAAIYLYKKNGYRCFDEVDDYYKLTLLK